MTTLVCSPCPVCEREIADGDVVKRVMDGDRTGWVHATCTADGVRRWVRADRPGDGPLAWSRSERPTWRMEPGDGRAVRHVGCAGECGPVECDRLSVHRSLRRKSRG